MNNELVSVLYDEVADLLPTLSPDQCAEIDEYIKENDLDSARFLLKFWAKNRNVQKARVGHESNKLS